MSVLTRALHAEWTKLRTVRSSAWLLVGVLTLTVVAGIVGSTGRSRTEAAARRASEESLAGSLLEHAARGERARIARELHDVVAHHISMISGPGRDSPSDDTGPAARRRQTTLRDRRDRARRTE